MKIDLSYLHRQAETGISQVAPKRTAGFLLTKTITKTKNIMLADYHNPNNYWQHNPMMQDPNIDPDDAMKSGCFVMIFYIVAFIVGVALCSLLGSCTTTEYVTVPEYHTDTLRITQHQRDSIWLHDSIKVTEKGDTVRIEKWHTKYVEKQVHDTLYQSKRDSIPYPVEVIKEVPRPLTKMQIVLMVVGFVCTFLVVAYIGRKIHNLIP